MSDDEPSPTFLQLLKRWLKGEASEDVGANFTPRAQQILSLARKAAIERGHPCIQADHILLGILQLNRGVAVDVLCRLGCRLPVMLSAISACLDRFPKEHGPGSPVYSEQAKALLAAAARQARHLSHPYVGSEHLLLGVLTCKGSESRRLLEALDLDAETLRVEILRELDPNFEPGDAGDRPDGLR